MPKLTLQGHALRYAEAGIPVFPLRPGTKEPATARGFHDATVNRIAVAQMFSGADYNIGTPTGVVFSVLDIDGAEGAEWVDRILALDFVPRPFGRVSTAADRPDEPHHHYYIPPTTGRRIGFLPGVDGLGDNGYAVLPPSIVDERGEPDKPWKWGTYQWIDEVDYDALGPDQGRTEPTSDDAGDDYPGLSVPF